MFVGCLANGCVTSPAAGAVFLKAPGDKGVNCTLRGRMPESGSEKGLWGRGWR